MNPSLAGYGGLLTLGDMSPDAMGPGIGHQCAEEDGLFQRLDRFGFEHGDFFEKFLASSNRGAMPRRCEEAS